MPNKRFLQEVEIELENLNQLIEELQKIIAENKTGADIILKTATASFMAQYYNGIENILKRITKYFDIPLPKTESWHYELFTYFCNPPYLSLPLLFDENIKSQISELRKFRHRVHHGYSFDLEWDDMLIGVNTVLDTFGNFSEKVQIFIKGNKDSQEE